jgi:DNA-binding NarL/FixJ family response regulator
MSEPIRILVADDHPLFLRGLVGLLSEQADFTLVGEASDGLEAVDLSRECEPHVVLLDLHMPGGGGLAVVGALKDSGARVLMLTISDKDEDLMEAIAVGADGYLLKSAEPEELCRAIRQVAAGHSVLSPEVTAAVMQAAADAKNGKLPVSLSPRERDVLVQLAQGATTAEIAEALFLSPSTVKTHVGHILEKLDASNRAEAVGRAAALGLLDPHPSTSSGS